MSLNFPLLLVIAVAVCGLLALLDLVFFAPRRRAAIASYQGSVSQPDGVVIEKLNKEPLLVEYGKSFFPVLFIVLVLRSFLVEPFQIPLGSMKPTLDVGDFILVNKFSYGIRLPVIDKKVIEVGDPQRGDVDPQRGFFLGALVVLVREFDDEQPVLDHLVHRFPVGFLRRDFAFEEPAVVQRRCSCFLRLL